MNYNHTCVLRDLVINIMNDFPNIITEPTYIDILRIHIIDFTSIFMTEHEQTIMLDSLNDVLTELNLVRSFINNENSSMDDYILKRPDIIEHINRIKETFQPEQRTDEWYKFRYDHLTASNAWKSYSSSVAVKNQLIFEKCKPFNKDKYKPSLCENPMSWGHKYEPLTTALYEKFNNTTIDEFGCIEHPKYPFLAASPDGIVTGFNNYGRMIEIKNVVSRTITGIPKTDYYIQTQIQMEVCDLDECDFVETKFIEYDTYDDYINDGTATETADKKQKGVIKVYVKNNEEFYYEYMPFNITDKESIDEWTESDTTVANVVWLKTLFWKLDVYSCVFIPRIKLWFDRTFDELDSIWKIILDERVTGEYVHRAPKSRKRKDLSVDKGSTCLINIT